MNHALVWAFARQVKMRSSYRLIVGECVIAIYLCMFAKGSNCLFSTPGLLSILFNFSY